MQLGEGELSFEEKESSACSAPRFSMSSSLQRLSVHRVCFDSNVMQCNVDEAAGEPVAISGGDCVEAHPTQGLGFLRCNLAHAAGQCPVRDMLFLFGAM